MALEVIAETEGDWPFGSLPSYTVGKVIKDRRAQFGLAHWTSHDLRRTALTQMGRLGVSPFIRGHVANHRTTTKAGMTLGVYDQYDYEKEKREALDLWAGRLSGIITGAAEVTPLRGVGNG